MASEGAERGAEPGRMSRYEDVAERTMHRLQDWGPPATRRPLPIQPSWLHRDPNTVDRIVTDATTKGTASLGFRVQGMTIFFHAGDVVTP
jgi:hypothetical protein